MFKALNKSTLVRVISSKSNGSASSKGTTASKSAPIKQSPLKSVNPSATSSTPNVQGLSPNVVKVPNTEVGPGASKTSNYKNPEYFSYHPFSYAEAEVEMIKFRLPQPSNKARL